MKGATIFFFVSFQQQNQRGKSLGKLMSVTVGKHLNSFWSALTAFHILTGDLIIVAKVDSSIGGLGRPFLSSSHRPLIWYLAWAIFAFLALHILCNTILNTNYRAILIYQATEIHQANNKQQGLLAI